MTAEAQDHDLTRQRIHDLADAIAAVVTKVAVIEERQRGVTQQLDRIETGVTKIADKAEDNTDRLTVLETNAAANKNDAAKWGAALGAFVAALISGIAAIFGGGK